MAETHAPKWSPRERFTSLGSALVEVADETPQGEVREGTYDSDAPHEAYGFGD